MKKNGEGYRGVVYLFFVLGIVIVFVLCVCLGSVRFTLLTTLDTFRRGLLGLPAQDAGTQAILLSVRLPRVLCAALMGAALSLCGGAMQGLLRNPLADGSTLGVSSGASLGAALSIAFGITLPLFPNAGTTVLSILFSFLSMLLILSLAQRIDHMLSTNTIILLGIIFSMFMNSLISLVVTFAGEKVRPIIFWTMGSLAGSNWANVLTLLVGLAVCAPGLLLHVRELNAFSIGEDNARHVGIHVKRVKLLLLVFVSALIGLCVSIGGTIGFVGLVIPHITRMLTGPNHRKLLPATLFVGGAFLMLADLVSRSVFAPRELPIGVVTSLIGAIVFLSIFYRARRAG
ncbi:iron ABC transporter permease [Ruminococcaceae bacterium OttesenSCG-928-I18]|nr:iron ABC transporter permease [Ruminococcaceae bacterium OttesenSCG-928-I18]